MALRLFDDVTDVTDVTDVLDEVARVLRPNGVFAATMNRAASLGSPMDLVFAELARAMRDDTNTIALPGDQRVSEVDSLRTLFPPETWRENNITDYDLHVEVPSASVPAWLRQAYYPIDQLANGSDFMRWLEEHHDILAPDGTMTWTFALREVCVRRR